MLKFEIFKFSKHCSICVSVCLKMLPLIMAVIECLISIFLAMIWSLFVSWISAASGNHQLRLCLIFSCMTHKLSPTIWSTIPKYQVILYLTSSSYIEATASPIWNCSSLFSWSSYQVSSTFCGMLSIVELFKLFKTSLRSPVNCL